MQFFFLVFHIVTNAKMFHTFHIVNAKNLFCVKCKKLFSVFKNISHIRQNENFGNKMISSSLESSSPECPTIRICHRNPDWSELSGLCHYQFCPGSHLRTSQNSTTVHTIVTNVGVNHWTKWEGRQSKARLRRENVA